MSIFDMTWLASGPAIEKSKSSLRWIILVFACLMLIGSYYCFDIPAALKTQIDDYMGDPSEYETYFGLLYTLYAVPNVILPFFGGYFVDKIGVRLSMLIFASLVALGQVIFSFGLLLESWPVMFTGRFVFGLGGESLVVANSALLADWFKGKELAFAFGINLSIARLGSVFNNLLSPPLTEMAGLVFACWFGALLCGASVFCVILTMPIDKAFDLKLEKLRKPLLEDVDASVSVNPMINDGQSKMEDSMLVPSSRPDSKHSTEVSPIWKQGSFTSNPPMEEPEKMTWRQAWNQFITETISLPHIFWVLVILCVVVYGCVLPFNNIESSLLLERNYFMTPPSDCALTYTGECQSSTNPPNGYCPASKWYQPPLPYNITLSDGTKYPGQVEYADVDCTESAWSDGCTVEFCDRLSTGESQASVIMSIPYIISAVMSPLLGLVIDRYGMRAIIAAIAPAILVLVHGLLGLTEVSPVGPLVGQGLAYTGFAAVLWPAVPLVIDEQLTGLAFGIVTSALNLATAVIPLIVAAIYTDSGDLYIPNVEILFVALGFIGFIVGIYLNFYDVRHGHVLNRGEDSSKKDYTAIDASESKANYDIYVVTQSKSTESTSRALSVESSPLHSDQPHHHVHFDGANDPSTHPEHRSHSSDIHHANRGDRHSTGSYTRGTSKDYGIHRGILTPYEEVHRGGAF